MIRQEEQLNRFSRRNRYHGFNYPEMAGKMAYPAGELICEVWSAKTDFEFRRYTSRKVDQGTIRPKEFCHRDIHDPCHRQRYHWCESNRSLLLSNVLITNVDISDVQRGGGFVSCAHYSGAFQNSGSPGPIGQLVHDPRYRTRGRVLFQ